MQEKDSSTRNPASPSGWKSASKNDAMPNRVPRVSIPSAYDRWSHFVWRAPRCSARWRARLTRRASSSSLRRSSKSTSAWLAICLRWAREIGTHLPANVSGLTRIPRDHQALFRSICAIARVLDWATQPDPFRRYPGARLIPSLMKTADERDREVTACRGASAPRLDRLVPALLDGALRVEGLSRTRAGPCASIRRAGTFIPPRLI